MGEAGMSLGVWRGWWQASSNINTRVVGAPRENEEWRGDSGVAA